MHNNTIGDDVYFLRAKIWHTGIVFRYSIARIVYYCFVRKFELSNKYKVILPIDGNGKNIVLQNLALVDIRRKQQRIFERKRLKREFVYAYDEFLEIGSEKASNPYCRQVSQYTMNGKKLKTFPSINTAALDKGLNEHGIVAVLKERQVSSGGFIWRYGKDRTTNIESFIAKRNEHRKKLVGQKVSQYTLKGERIATRLTLADAAKSIGRGSGEISGVLSGRRKSSGGFIWKRGWGKKRIPIGDQLFGEALRAQRMCKKVKQYNLDGRFLRTFPSVKEAAKSIRVKPSSLSGAIRTQSQRSGGFKWRFA
jgi:hypothetical protein